MKKRLLTVPEAAQELGITERAAWQRVYRGQIPFRRWGKKVVIPADELDLFIKSLPGLNAEQAAAKVEEHAA
jgi:excisionase family DNA binding protein